MCYKWAEYYPVEGGMTMPLVLLGAFVVVAIIAGCRAARSTEVRSLLLGRHIYVDRQVSSYFPGVEEYLRQEWQAVICPRREAEVILEVAEADLPIFDKLIVRRRGDNDPVSASISIDLEHIPGLIAEAIEEWESQNQEAGAKLQSSIS